MRPWIIWISSGYQRPSMSLQSFTCLTFGAEFNHPIIITIESKLPRLQSLKSLSFGDEFSHWTQEFCPIACNIWPLAKSLTVLTNPWSRWIYLPNSKVWSLVIDLTKQCLKCSGPVAWKLWPLGAASISCLSCHKACSLWLLEICSIADWIRFSCPIALRHLETLILGTLHNIVMERVALPHWSASSILWPWLHSKVGWSEAAPRTAQRGHQRQTSGYRGCRSIFWAGWWGWFLCSKGNPDIPIIQDCRVSPLEPSSFIWGLNLPTDLQVLSLPIAARSCAGESPYPTWSDWIWPSLGSLAKWVPGMHEICA